MYDVTFVWEKSSSVVMNGDTDDRAGVPAGTTHFALGSSAFDGQKVA